LIIDLYYYWLISFKIDSRYYSSISIADTGIWSLLEILAVYSLYLILKIINLSDKSF
jgi:hypothetical protein